MIRPRMLSMLGTRLLGYWLPGLLVTVSMLAGCTNANKPAEDPGAGTGAASGVSGSGPKRIVILTNGPDPFWDTCGAGAKAAEKDLGLAEKGYSVTFIQPAAFDTKLQLDQLKQYGLQTDIAAVGISVLEPDSAAIADELRSLQKRGVKVITIDGDIDREQFRDARHAYVGTDNLVGGRELGRAAKAVAAEGAKYTFFVGNTSAANAVARMDGFVEGAGDKLVKSEALGDGGDATTARKNVEGALDRDPSLNMLVGIWAYNTPQIAAVVKDRGIRDKTKVICFDADQTSIAEMSAGNIDVMVVQNPFQMGYDGVKLLHALSSDDKATVDTFLPDYAQEAERDTFRTELRVVAPEGSPIKADLFEKETIFMSFPDFKKWLEERSLISS